jgi:transposase
MGPPSTVKTGHRGDHRPWPARRVKADEAGVTTESVAANPANGTDQVTTDPGPPQPSRSPSASASLPFHELIEAGLAKGRNAMGIWQYLVDRSGFTGAYESVKRYVHKLRGARTPEPCAVVLTPAGEEAQADYGSGPMVRDPHTGKYRRTRLLVMTLGYSRKSVRLLVFESSEELSVAPNSVGNRSYGTVPLSVNSVNRFRACI